MIDPPVRHILEHNPFSILLDALTPPPFEPLPTEDSALLEKGFYVAQSCPLV